VRARLDLTGLLLLAGAWGFLDGFFVAPRPGFFWPILIAGIACLVLDRRAAGKVPADEGRYGSGAARALMITGLHLGMQAALPRLLAHLHRIEGAGGAAAALLGLAGIPSGVDAEGNLLVGTAAGTTGIALTWELAGLPMILRLLAAVWVAGGWRGLPRNATAIAAAAGLRVLVLVAALAGGARVSLAYEPAVTLLSFVPALFLIRIPRGPAEPLAASAIPRAATVVLVGAAGLCAGLFAGWRDPGTAGEGRVLIDESRSDWEWTAPPFDHARYGRRSLYSYSLWRAWIELHYPTRVLDSPPSDKDLGGADVLIIKTPTSPYDAGTIARIERFVREGGGLYLIGDHTNLYGMSTVLNAVAAPYGLAFEHDDTFPLDHEGYDIFEPEWLAPHPVLRGVESYPFETSCTSRVPWTAEHLMVGRRLGAEMVDYGHVNFFGDIKLEASERFGLFVQAALLRHGRGRVAVFSDSTNFSSFSMLWPGRRRLTLNILDWLNRDERRESHRFVPFGLLAVSIAAASAGARLLARASLLLRAASLWAGVIAFALSAHASSAASARAMGTPPPRAAWRSAAFDVSLGELALEKASPILSRDAGGSWRRFNAFFINAARSNIWPVVTQDLVAALGSHHIVILVNPSRRPSVAQVEALGAFVRGGGRLLVIDTILNARSTAAEILAPFGLAPALDLVPVADGGAGAMAPAMRASGAEGVGRRLTPGGGTALWRDAGGGRVVFFSDSALFSDWSFGGVYTTPTRGQEEIYQAQEEVIRILLEPRVEEKGHDRD
jgi:hypothetical protein